MLRARPRTPGSAGKSLSGCISICFTALVVHHFGVVPFARATPACPEDSMAWMAAGWMLRTRRCSPLDVRIPEISAILLATDWSLFPHNYHVSGDPDDRNQRRWPSA